MATDSCDSEGEHWPNLVMGTGMGDDINCSVPEVPLAHLEDDIDFIKVASQQS
uniref:Uncharacterized protein n=1 Tax=Setaria digitata TaxID=48799 RepID=A0A915PIY2_9BILA